MSHVCASCGRRTSLSPAEHFASPECLIAEVMSCFEQRGWAMVIAGSGSRTSVTLANVCAALGRSLLDAQAVGLLKRAPGCVLHRYDHEAQCNTKSVSGMWWAPAAAVRAARLVEGLHLTAGATTAALRRAYGDPQWADALAAAKALGGSTGARVFVIEWYWEGVEVRQ